MDCQRCNKAIQRIRGCEEDVSPMNIGGYEVTRCPLNYVTGIENMYMEAYLMYESGFLPNDGGWLKQPMRFTAIMTLIDSLFTKFGKDRKQYGE